MNPGLPQTSADLTQLSLQQAAALLRNKQVSPVELTRACLERIERLEPKLHAFITLTAELALEQARAAEQEIARGNWKGPLHGIPVGLKDLVDMAGVATTGASAAFRDRVPTEDSEIVRRLRAAGAVLMGKLNLHECAYGGSGLISAFGVTRNPWDLERIAGGSSSGSAAAVAAGLIFAAIGTDTAGSVRLPSALCGMVGFKPSYGLVSLRGVVPLSWSLDHVGPITRTVGDAAAMLGAIAGYDPEDLDSRAYPAADYLAALKQSPSRLRLGVPRNFFYSALDPEVQQAVEQALRLLENLTCGIQEIGFSFDSDRTVQASEAFSFYRPLLPRISHSLHPQTLRRIEAGAEIKAAHYVERRRELERLRRTSGNLFSNVDLLVTPTTPTVAPQIAELESHLDELRKHELVLLRNTRPFNDLGLPAITVPCGFTSGGLPVGIQISGPAGEEGRVLSLAHAYEQMTAWPRVPRFEVG